MGLSCELMIKTNFIYKTAFGNGLTEHELDYVLIGSTNQDPRLNKEEAESFEWKKITEIKKDITLDPDKYTSWFKIAIEKLF